MPKYIKYFFPLLLLLFLTSCDVINPDEPIPAYIQIDKIDVSTNPVSEGSASSKITDAWVYVDGNLIGIFELPAKFPVLKEGEHDLIIKPGIKVNGISNTRAYYPFYKQYEATVTFVKGEVMSIHPVVTYYPDMVNWVEDFEGGGQTIETTSTDDTAMIKCSDPTQVFEGSYSGMVHLTASKPHFFGITMDEYVLPATGAPVFLEMNYKTNCKIYVGMYAYYQGNTTRIETIRLNEMPEWNKIYINLTETLQQQPNASGWKVYLDMYRPDSIDSPVAYFDNLKLVYSKP
ncbi:MAG: hypothetical protein WCM76_04685 [Bacteroidota bacterium]